MARAKQPEKPNKLYYGDNLDILRRKIHDETVDLCYIDPPFNSSRRYFQIYNNIGGEDRAQAQAFVDTWEWGDEAAAAPRLHHQHQESPVRQDHAADCESDQGLDTVLGAATCSPTSCT